MKEMNNSDQRQEQPGDSEGKHPAHRIHQRDGGDVFAAPKVGTDLVHSLIDRAAAEMAQQDWAHWDELTPTEASKDEHAATETDRNRGGQTGR